MPYFKNFAAAFAAAALILCHAPSALAAGEETVVPIIMYHEVRPTGARKDVVLPEELEADLIYYAENGYTSVTMDEVIRHVYLGEALPEKPIVITFDDGYLNNYTYVLPLIKKYGVKIVLSVITKSADDFTAAQDSNPSYAHMTWDELREMTSTGLVEMQNHTRNMHKCAGGMLGCQQMDGEPAPDFERRLTSDVTAAQESMTRELGKTPTVFTYPYGLGSALSEDILRELGFAATLSCDFGVNRLTQDPDCLMMMKRICRVHGEDLGTLLDTAFKYPR